MMRNLLLTSISGTPSGNAELSSALSAAFPSFFPSAYAYIEAATVAPRVTMEVIALIVFESTGKPVCGEDDDKRTAHLLIFRPTEADRIVESDALANIVII